MINKNQALIDALTPLVDILTDMIADKIKKKMLDENKPREIEFYNRAETANLLHITLPTLYKITKEGVINSVKIGGRVLYDAEEINRVAKNGCRLKYRKHAGQV